jgi:hypothetical protein
LLLHAVSESAWQLRRQLELLQRQQEQNLLLLQQLPQMPWQ